MNKHPFRPLRHGRVRILWSAAVVSDIGTWVQLIVVASLIAADTGSAVRTGLVALATFMPQGIASPVGGLLADRFDRRTVFASALLLQAAMTTALAVTLAFGVRDAGVLTVFILLASAAGSFGAPSYAAMQPDLVPPDELMAMISLGVYSWNAGRIVGPLLGTALVLAVGPAWTIGFNAFSFLVLAGAVWSLRGSFRPAASSGSLRERLAEGFVAVRRTPGCAHGIAVLVLFNITVVPFMGLIPIYAAAEFAGGTGLAGVLSSSQGVGAILGGIVVTVLAARRRRSELLAGLVAITALALVAYAMAPTRTTVAAAVVFLGASASGLMVCASTIIQRDAPPAKRGRVMSLMQACMGVSYGIGLMLIGGLGDLTDLRLAFTVGGLALPVAFWALTRRSRHWRAAVDGREQPIGDPQLVAA